MSYIYFKYRALDSRGSSIDGIVRSKSREEARLKLIDRDLTPLSLRRELLFRSKLRDQDLYLYCRKLSSLLKAGINIKTSMLILEEDTGNIALKIASKDIAENIERGDKLSLAASKTDIFPNIFINMLEVGEESGNLDQVLDQLSSYFYKSYSISKKFKDALIYPIILVILTFLISIFLFRYIVPQFKEIFLENSIDLPLITQGVIAISDIFLYRAEILFIIPILFISIILILHLDYFKFYLDIYKIKYSLFKSIHKKLSILKIFTPLSMMYQTGIPIGLIFNNLIRHSENLYIKKELESIDHKIENGESLSMAFSSSNISTNMINNSIKVGEETGSLDTILVDINSYYEDDIIYSLDRYAILLEPIIIVIVGFIIASITIGLVLPIINLVDIFL